MAGRVIGALMMRASSAFIAVVHTCLGASAGGSPALAAPRGGPGRVEQRDVWASAERSRAARRALRASVLAAVAGRRGARVAELDHLHGDRAEVRARSGSRSCTSLHGPGPRLPTIVWRSAHRHRAAHSPFGSTRTLRCANSPPVGASTSDAVICAPDPGRCRSHDPRCLPTRCGILCQCRVPLISDGACMRQR